MFIAYALGCIIGLVLGLSLGYSVNMQKLSKTTKNNYELQKEVHRLNRLV